MSLAQEQQLIALARATLLDALIAVRSLGLTSWCIGAGAVRNLVWDAMHQQVSTPTDIDVVYFDTASGVERQSEIHAQLNTMRPDLPWDVCNQALVHLWYEKAFGRAVPALTSLADGISTWPEYATAVGLTLEDDDRITVIAPFGLDDLFAGIVRHNPRRASYANYQQRIIAKKYTERWPKLTVIA